ncbi:MAG: hypothetical protein HKN30_12715 [Sulfitobacter sp.]|nr:hypothetical protein [Sulfitobacter sp.]
MIAALTSQGAAYDREDSREERAAQVIYNALYRTRDAGEPSQAAVEGYRRSKPVGSQVGTGLQGIGNPTDEDGWGMYVKYDVIFPSAEGIDQIRSDYGQFFEFERTDGRTGAESSPT